MQDIIDQRKPPWNIDERGWSSVPGLLTSYGLKFGIFEELDTRKEGVSQSHSFKVYRDVLDIRQPKLFHITCLQRRQLAIGITSHPF